MPEPERIWGPGELCREFGISRQTLSVWRRLDGFPQPVRLSQGDVWTDPDEVRRWVRRRKAAQQR